MKQKSKPDIKAIIQNIKKNRYLYAEILSVAVLIIFIIVLCAARSGGTDKSIEEISSPVISTLQKGEMSKKTNADAIREFGIDISKTDGIVYYENENIMNVSEMLIVKLKNENDAREFESAIKKRVKNQKNLYKNYAPEAYALLNDCIIKTSSNTVFYCTSKNADELYETFKEAM